MLACYCFLFFKSSSLFISNDLGEKVISEIDIWECNMH